jgi:hypothetical protein
MEARLFGIESGEPPSPHRQPIFIRVSWVILPTFFLCWGCGNYKAAAHPSTPQRPVEK